MSVAVEPEPKEHPHNPAAYCPFAAWAEETIVEALRMGQSLHDCRESFDVVAAYLTTILETHRERCRRCRK